MRPASIIATKFDAAGAVVATRPLCPYPQRAFYQWRRRQGCAQLCLPCGAGREIPAPRTGLSALAGLG